MKMNGGRVPVEAQRCESLPIAYGPSLEESPPRASHPRQLLEQHADWILRTAAKIARGKGIREADVADFAGWVVERLMSRNFNLLRACKQPERIRFYLGTVIRNLAKDYCNHLWGKWRPSSLARRLGATAIDLERLCQRDGWQVREAIEILRSNHDCKVTAEELEDVASQLPSKPARTFVELDLEHMGQQLPFGERLLAREREVAQERISETLRSALSCLEAQDLEILRLHFEERRSLASISRTHQLDQRSLYSRRTRSLKRMRQVFQQEGLTWQEIAPALGGESLGALEAG
ncbi:MAG: sigma-70 family RNA polymerase sigma factor [Deltaproteobacteria bacterium]|nr:sigma-70 family RNA polymerase sigma factor [Deltaproteobacteria bacterium]